MVWEARKTRRGRPWASKIRIRVEVPVPELKTSTRVEQHSAAESGWMSRLVQMGKPSPTSEMSFSNRCRFKWISERGGSAGDVGRNIGAVLTLIYASLLYAMNWSLKDRFSG